MTRITRNDLEISLNYLSELMGEPLHIYSYAPDSKRRYYIHDARNQPVDTVTSHDLGSVYAQVRFAIRCIERMKDWRKVGVS